jgi:hypothetical protein
LKTDLALRIAAAVIVGGVLVLISFSRRAKSPKTRFVLVQIACVPGAIAFVVEMCIIHDLSTRISIGTLLLGLSLNVVAMGLNGGRMPHRPYRFLSEDGESPKHVLISSDTKVRLICDIIPVPKGYGMVSIGDIIAVAGMLLWMAYMTLLMFKHHLWYLAVGGH